MFTLLQRACGARAKASRFAAALALGAVGLCWLSTSNAYAQSGWVRQYTGQLVPPGVRTQEVPACYGGTYCQFWETLDRNAFTARIAAGHGQLYQLQYSGAIFKYPSTPCTTHCPGWWLVEYDPAAKAIYANDESLYKMRQDGSVWENRGGAWSEVESADSGRITIAVGSFRIAGLYADGSITMTRLGRKFGNAVAIAVDGNDDLYRLSANGDIETLRWRWSNNWAHLDNNPATIAITAGGIGQFYQLHNNGSVWRFTGTDCNFLQPYPQCRGWEKLDNNPATVRIMASVDELYKLHDNGSLWRWTGTPCDGDSCTGWELLIANGVGRIALDGNRVYTLTRPVVRSTRQRVCSECL